MNSSNDLQVVGENGVINKQICTEKRFKVGDTTWNYQNLMGLSLMNEDGTSALKIKNHLCEMAGNKIKKITQIYFKKKKYVIEDHYTLHLSDLLNQVMQKDKSQDQKDSNTTNESENKSKTKDKNDQKKTYIFKKSKYSKSDPSSNSASSRNTKNITKNFCKAFQVFLRSGRVPDADIKELREGLQEYHKLLPSRRFNNNSIKKIIRNEILRDLFRLFLEREARHWISESRISDKGLHEEAISIYLNLFERMAIQDEFSDSQIDNSELIENEFKQE